MTTKPALTLTALMTRFSTEEACKQFLTEKRWPNGVECPRCQNKKVYELTSKPFHWACKGKDCGGRNGYRFSVITKTAFENTNSPLADLVSGHLFDDAEQEGDQCRADPPPDRERRLPDGLV